MAVTNTYTINGESAKAIDAGAAYIDLAPETGVKAGCKEYPIPLLNKITVKSEDGELSKSRTIYAGYKIVNQMLGALIPTGSNYNPNNPNLATIISNGRFGIFEPAHFISTGKWGTYDLNPGQIDSLLNIGIGIKICVKIEYTKSGGSPSTTYVPIFGASNRFDKVKETAVPPYAQIGGNTTLNPLEVVQSWDIENYDKRTWFQSVLVRDTFDIDLGLNITDPDTTKTIAITLMAYIGDDPNADNTFTIKPMNSVSKTSIVVPFDTYNPTIDIVNKDNNYNPDNYADGYGSVADYQAGSSEDTTLYVTIVAP